MIIKLTIIAIEDGIVESKNSEYKTFKNENSSILDMKTFLLKDICYELYYTIDTVEVFDLGLKFKNPKLAKEQLSDTYLINDKDDLELIIKLKKA